MTRPPLVPPGTPLVSGRLYARLFHGRRHPDQLLDGWGFAGPVFGPLTGVSLTYLQHVRLWGEGGSEVHLWSHGDLLVWDDGYFGDVEVFVAETSACQAADSVASYSPSAEGDRP